MSKLVFVYDPGQAPRESLRMIMPEGMQFEFFDRTCVYPADTVFYYDMYGPGHDHIRDHLAAGYRVVFDAKNEHYIHNHMYNILYSFLQHPGQGCFIISGHEPDPLPGVKIIATPNWYWIVDQANLRRNGVNQIVWQSRPDKKKFFMSLNNSRQERDYLFERLRNHLADSVYSYRSRGINLPNDHADSALQQGYINPEYQRYINPEWMHSTAVTLAVETFVDETITSGCSLTQQNQFFLTEKTYKPLAAQHPLLLVSTPGNLAHLRSQGFETFPELFDESYDGIANWQKRVQRIIAVLSDFDPGSVDQPCVLEKLRYNQYRFFDRSITKQLAFDTIQQPLFEFVNG